MKTYIALFLTLVILVASLAGCTSESTPHDGYTVAIVQQMDHSSLDEIRLAVESRLNEISAQQGISITCQSYNGQNDSTVLNQIGAQIVSDGVDAIIPIATTAAVCMVTAAEGTDIPVIYAAISDPASADLTGLEQVTGTSDALNTSFILDMMLAVQPQVETVGLLYSNSEPNSVTPIAQAKAYLDEKGIAYLEKTGSSTDEILTAANSLVGRVQAVFTPTDNVVMAAEGAIAEVFTASGIAHYTGADSFVTSGAFVTCGVNYTQLGRYTADMAVDAMCNGVIPEYHVMEGGVITVNTATAQALGLDYSVFATLADTVKEVK